MCFFGAGGSHEYTEEGFQAAQKNTAAKDRLLTELKELNAILRLSSFSREKVTE